MERYLGEANTQEKIHKNMAEYFAGVWSGQKKSFNYSAFLQARLALASRVGEEDRNVSKQPLMFVERKSETIFNKRKLSELPYHLVKCSQFEKLSSECIFNYNWLWSKISAYGLQMVVEDLEFALLAHEDAEIQALADTLRIAGWILNDYPENLGLEISGRLLDYLNTMPKIRQLINECDQLAHAHSAIVTPFQLYEIPQSALIKSIESPPADVGAILLIEKDSKIVTLCIDGTVQTWDAKNGSPINEVKIPVLKAASYKNLGLYITKDERFIVCESRPSGAHLAILHADTLEVVREHKMANIHWNHNLVLFQKYVCMDNAVFQTNSGRKVRDLNSYRRLESFVVVAFTVCDKYLLIGGENAVDVFTVQKGKRVKQLLVTNNVTAIKLTSNGHLAIVGTTVDCIIKLFDMNDESETFGHEVVTYDPAISFPNEVTTADNYSTSEVSGIYLSKREDAIVGLIRRKYPILWSLKNDGSKPKLLRLSKGDSLLRYLFYIQFSADDKFIVAAELSPNVMIWDSGTGDLLATFQPHENDVHDIVLGTRTGIAVMLQQNSSIVNVWDLQKVLTMHKISSVKQQQFSVKNKTLSSKCNVLFMSRVQPAVSTKAYHFIDYFGVDVLDLTTGKLGTLLPFDKYGQVQSIANSVDASIVAVCTGTQQTGNISVLDVPNRKLVQTLSVPVCKSVLLSNKGDYLCAFISGQDIFAQLFVAPKYETLRKFPGCKSGMFTKENAFVGIANSQLLVQVSMNEDELLKLDLPGEVIGLQYSEATDMLLVTVDDRKQISVTVFKTHGFVPIGTMRDVSKDGISDVADDGSICIDTELQIFELDSCTNVKKLLSNEDKINGISSVRLSSKGEHAVFIARSPTNCVKVFRIRDSQIVARAFLHCVPENLEVVPAINAIVVISKNKKLFVLTLRDMERKYIFYSREERLTEIISVRSTLDVTTLEMSVDVREELKKTITNLQIKYINLESSHGSTYNHSDDGKTITLRQTHHVPMDTQHIGKASSRSCAMI